MKIISTNRTEISKLRWREAEEKARPGDINLGVRLEVKRENYGQE